MFLRDEVGERSQIMGIQASEVGPHGVAGAEDFRKVGEVRERSARSDGGRGRARRSARSTAGPFTRAATVSTTRPWGRRGAGQAGRWGCRRLRYSGWGAGSVRPGGDVAMPHRCTRCNRRSTGLGRQGTVKRRTGAAARRGTNPCGAGRSSTPLITVRGRGGVISGPARPSVTATPTATVATTLRLCLALACIGPDLRTPSGPTKAIGSRLQTGQSGRGVGTSCRAWLGASHIRRCA